jgi:hypothetical protein
MFLDAPSVLRVGAVSHACRGLGADRVVWARLLLRDFRVTCHRVVPQVHGGHPALPQGSTGGVAHVGPLGPGGSAAAIAGSPEAVGGEPQARYKQRRVRPACSMLPVCAANSRHAIRCSRVFTTVPCSRTLYLVHLWGRAVAARGRVRQAKATQSARRAFVRTSRRQALAAVLVHVLCCLPLGLLVVVSPTLFMAFVELKLDKVGGRWAERVSPPGTPPPHRPP